MDLKTGSTRFCLVVHFVLLGISLHEGGWPAQAQAQTALSPVPILPLPEYLSSPAFDLATSPAPESAITAEQKSGVNDEAEKQSRIPLILNESVESQIEFFTTKGRAVFQSWLNRSSRYLPIMKRIFREFNLPEDLVYIAMIESGFNLHAVSPKKAVGPWQFLKATGREYGLSINRWVDERRDPIKSTRAAAALFKDLYRMFGSWAMAVASYNAGMGRMQGAIRKARSDDFWEIRSSQFLHMETQDYVPRYMAAMMIAKDPAGYGFKEPGSKPFEYDEIVVQKSIDLRRLAGHSGCPYEEILELNPELVGARTPQSHYILRIPARTSGACERQIAGATGKQTAHEEQEQAEPVPSLYFHLTSQQPVFFERMPTPLDVISPYGSNWALEQTWEQTWQSLSNTDKPREP